MQSNQKGYILIECLIGIILLAAVGISLIQTLPKLLSFEQQLHVEQTIYNKLFELKDQTLFYDRRFEFPLTFYEPIHYQVFEKDHQLCATYQRGDTSVQTLCF